MSSRRKVACVCVRVGVRRVRGFGTGRPGPPLLPPPARSLAPPPPRSSKQKLRAPSTAAPRSQRPRALCVDHFRDSPRPPRPPHVLHTKAAPPTHAQAHSPSDSGQKGRERTEEVTPPGGRHGAHAVADRAGRGGRERAGAEAGARARAGGGGRAGGGRQPGTRRFFLFERSGREPAVSRLPPRVSHARPSARAALAPGDQRAPLGQY
jgi:hypothetical protein